MHATNMTKTSKNILFLDIETVSCKATYEDLEAQLKPLWDKKALAFGKAELEAVSKLYVEKAAIYAEFGKVIVIGLGMILDGSNNEPQLHVKAFSDHHEMALLEKFSKFLTTEWQQSSLRLCAHNGKEFDFPYLCRRMLIHGIPLPQVLDTAGKKPWEVNHLDTMEMWRFGDKKSFTSLHLLATLFDIVSSKELMDGSQVNDYYYNKKDLASISQYCMQDVMVTAQLFLKLNGWQTIKKENIVFIE